VILIRWRLSLSLFLSLSPSLSLLLAPRASFTSTSRSLSSFVRGNYYGRPLACDEANEQADFLEKKQTRYIRVAFN